MSITIDGDSYLKYKKAYEGIKDNKHGIDFGNTSFYSYGWTFYTKDEAILEMAKQYEHINFKHLEQYNLKIAALKNQIEQLKTEITNLKSFK